MNRTSIYGLSLWPLVLLFTSFIATNYGFGIYLFAAIAPEMQAELGFSYAEMGITTGFAQAGFLASALASGFLTSWIGAYRLVKISITLCCLSLFGLVWADNFTLSSLFLIIMGCCAASVWVPMVEVAQTHIPKRHQGKALGLMSSGTSYGVFINSLLIFWLLPIFDWRALWAATAFLVFAIALWGILFLHTLDRKSVSENHPAPPPTPPRSWRVQLASLPKSFVSLIMVMMFFNGLACLPYQTYLSSFLVTQHGASLPQSAFAWQIIGLVGMVGGFTMGWIADRFSVRRTLTIVYSFLFLSTALLLFSSGDRLSIFILAVLFGLSFYSIFGLIPAYISLTCKTGSAALVFALGNVALGLGGITGNIAGGLIQELTGSLRGSYIITSVSATLLIGMSLLMQGEENH